MKRNHFYLEGGTIESFGQPEKNVHIYICACQIPPQL
jgi:hypothetical protein